MAPSYSGVWNISTQYQYASVWPFDANLGSVGLVSGGTDGSSNLNTIEKFVPESDGNGVDFGDLSGTRNNPAAVGNDVRHIVAGGYIVNVIDFVSYATAGNATDFGDLVKPSHGLTSCSNNVRGVFAAGNSYTGGSTLDTTTIDYITIASAGNATDFGDVTVATKDAGSKGITSSSTRGVFGGGILDNGSLSNVIQYITLASAGNATDFGDLSVARQKHPAGMSSSTRVVFAGGEGASGDVNTIDYITIASTGNASDFGDMTIAKESNSGASSATKGFMLGGIDSSGTVNTIEQITIASTGNAIDFGDLLAIKRQVASSISSQAAVQNEAGFPPAAIGLFAGNTAYDTHIIYVDIATDGVGASFGDLSVGRTYSNGEAASSTRALFMGGYNGSESDTIDYNTFSTKGKAIDFGNLSESSYSHAQFSSSTRAIKGTGGDPQSNTIEYVTIASTGDVTDFGDATVARNNTCGSASTTRGLVFGGSVSGGARSDVIDYVTIASAGNSTDFGNLIETLTTAAAASSNTRALIAGGIDSTGSTNRVSYITIASTGNATDFGDMSRATYYGSGLSDKTVALFPATGGSLNNPRLDKFTIASTGNAADWGDLVSNSHTYMTSSNSHGGIA